MSELSNPPPRARPFDFRRLLTIFTKPRQSLSELTAEGRAVWLTPMLALTLTAVLVVLVSGFMRARADAQVEVQLPPDWQYWSPDMQENFMQAQQSKQGPVFVYILPMLGSLISLWLGWMVFSGMLHLASTILGGRGSLRGALNVVAWAGTPYLIRDVLQILFMVGTGSAIASPGLSGFAGDSGFLSSLLSHTDLFLVWNILLLGVGVIVSEGLPRGRAFGGVIVIVLTILLIQAGIGALGSSFNLSSAFQPYM
jgi:hypothetical protein